jgi:hypothetical protein
VATQDDGVNQLRGLNANLAQLANYFSSAFPLRAFSGTFTCAAASTTTVSSTDVKAASTILLTPMNAAAGTLQSGGGHLYVSARTAGVSFSVTTANSTAAAGTELFSYIIVNVG